MQNNQLPANQPVLQVAHQGPGPSVDTRGALHIKSVAPASPRGQEVVTIVWCGSAPLHLRGWQLRDNAARNVYTFGDVTLRPGANLRVASGGDPARDTTTEVYRGQSGATWCRKTEVLHLLDPAGMVHAQYFVTALEAGAKRQYPQSLINAGTRTAPDKGTPDTASSQNKSPESKTPVPSGEAPHARQAWPDLHVTHGRLEVLVDQAQRAEERLQSLLAEARQQPFGQQPASQYERPPVSHAGLPRPDDNQQEAEPSNQHEARPAGPIRQFIRQALWRLLTKPAVVGVLLAFAFGGTLGSTITGVLFQQAGTTQPVEEPSDQAASALLKLLDTLRSNGQLAEDLPKSEPSAGEDGGSDAETPPPQP